MAPQRFLLLALLALLVGCSTPRYALIGTARAPGIQGLIEVEHISDDRLLLTAVMDELDPLPAGQYFVWLVAEGTAQPMGAVGYKREKRQGTIMLKTKLRNFELRVTVETDAEPATPSNLVVATQHIRESE